MLLSACLLIGMVSVLLFFDTNTYRQKLENISPYKMSGDQSSPSTSKTTELVDVRYLFDHLVVLTAF